MRPEYDFRGGVRGKHAKAMQAGYTITIHQDDGTTTVQTVESRQGTVLRRFGKFLSKKGW